MKIDPPEAFSAVVHRRAGLVGLNLILGRCCFVLWQRQRNGEVDTTEAIAFEPGLLVLGSRG